MAKNKQTNKPMTENSEVKFVDIESFNDVANQLAESLKLNDKLKIDYDVVDNMAEANLRAFTNLQADFEKAALNAKLKEEHLIKVLNMIETFVKEWEELEKKNWLTKLVKVVGMVRRFVELIKSFKEENADNLPVSILA